MVKIYLEGLYNNAAHMEDKKCHVSVYNLKREGAANSFSGTQEAT